ncbi:hypothetical protein CM15mP35_03000 [bacterium]|nr:MAG: hypothetical protein CM15mP35_03000 [bacterium]
MSFEYIFGYYSAQLHKIFNYMEDELVSIKIDSFDKLSIIDFSIVGKALVAIDIRDI